MLEIVSLVILIYFLFLSLILYQFSRQKEFHTAIYPPVKQSFSVIIAFKNEEQNLPLLINSLNKLAYPKENFEIILVDDYSSDNGKKILQNALSVPFLILNNQNDKKSSKKGALETGIKKAKHPFIITTDADCEVNKYWLEEMNALYQKEKPKMILGPVKYKDNPDFLGQFQIFEFLSLQAFTSASLQLGYPFLSNGANLGFDKKSFFSLKAYDGNKHIASGDDIFLLEKFRKAFPGKIAYLKSKKAIVTTQPQKNWKDLYQQKIRWASKTKNTDNYFGRFLTALIFLSNLAVLYLLIFFFSHPFLFATLLGIKLFIDFVLVKKSANFFKNTISYKYFLPAFFIYPFYMLVILFGINRKKYSWKGNKYHT